jgi:bifunctional DNase/RNase
MNRRAGLRARQRGGALLLIALLAGCRSGPPPEVEVEVKNVGYDADAGAPVVILQARESERVLPIWIGQAEAQAIAMEMQKVTPPRPMTHDLMKRILEQTGVALRRVRITELREQTFVAMIVLENGGREVEIDSRPSDAIALALRVACPILVSRTLLERDTTGGMGGQRGASAKIWGLTVQDLNPALAESLGVGTAEGVVVSDVDSTSDERPRRGDVIVAVDGTPVESVAELRALAGDGGGTHRLEVRRGAAHVTLQYDASAGPG